MSSSVPQEVVLSWSDVLSLCVSTLCILGSGLILLSYSQLKSLHNFAFRLVMFMSAAELFHSLGALSLQLMSAYEFISRDSCLIFGWFNMFMNLSALSWGTSMAYTLHNIILRNNVEIGSSPKTYHLICWGVPLVLSLLPTLNGQGSLQFQAGATCWFINGNLSPSFWDIFNFYGPEWILIIYNVIIFSLMTRFVDKMTASVRNPGGAAMDGVVASMMQPLSQVQQEAMLVKLTIVYKLRFYCLVLIMAALCNSALFFTMLQSSKFAPDDWLLAVFLIFSNGRAFFASIVFIVGYNLPKRWREARGASLAVDGSHVASGETQMDRVSGMDSYRASFDGDGEYFGEFLVDSMHSSAGGSRASSRLSATLVEPQHRFGAQVSYLNNNKASRQTSISQASHGPGQSNYGNIGLSKSNRGLHETYASTVESHQLHNEVTVFMGDPTSLDSDASIEFRLIPESYSN